MTRFLIPALAAMTLAGTAQAQTQSAEAVASAVLHGFLQRDASLIAPHSNATNAEFLAQAAADPEFAEELWDGIRGTAGTTWDGFILPARYTTNSDGLPQAVVPFAIEAETTADGIEIPSGVASITSDAPGRYISIILTLDTPDDTTWGAEDMHFIDRQDYLNFAETR